MRCAQSIYWNIDEEGGLPSSGAQTQRAQSEAPSLAVAAAPGDIEGGTHWRNQPRPVCLPRNEHEFLASGTSPGPSGRYYASVGPPLPASSQRLRFR